MATTTEEAAAILRSSELCQAATNSYLSDTTSRASRLKAIEAAKTLLINLQHGEDALLTQYEEIGAAYALRTAMSFGVLQATPLQGSIHIRDLAKAVNAEPSFLKRILNVMVAAGYGVEIERDMFAHTRQSRLYLDPGYVAYHQIMTDDVASVIWKQLPAFFETHERKSPDDMKHNPLTYAFGMEGHDWHEIFARSPELLQKFMLGMGSTAAAVPAFGAYPFGEQLAALSKQAQAENSFFWVDVGAGNGGITKIIREAHPELSGKAIVQDMERVVSAIPDGFLPDGVEAMAYDFWTPQPVKAKVYYLRRIMHDWPDAMCVKILQNQLAAMDDDSIILISDTVVPDRIQRLDTYPYWMDFVMLSFAGCERNAEQWERLFDMAGIELVKIWAPEAGTSCVIEGRKKRT